MDVRDLAAAHIAAMETPEAAGKRFIVCQSPGMWMKELTEVIAEEFETQGYKLPSWHIPKPGLWLAKFFSPVLARVYPALGKQFTYRTERIREVLGIEHRDIKASIIDTCYDLIERGLVQRTSGYRGRREGLTVTPDEQEQAGDELVTATREQDEEEEEPIVESTTTSEREEGSENIVPEEQNTEEAVEDCRHEENIQERTKSLAGEEKEDEVVEAADEVKDQHASTEDTIADNHKEAT